MLSRRAFLTALGALALPLPALASGPARTLLAAAADDGGPFFGATGGPLLGAAGGLLPSAAGGKAVPLAGRGHGIVPVPGTTQAIVVARRAGYWLARIDWAAGALLREAEAAPERHFFGHALLSPDGTTLYTTENDIASGRGVIGVWDAASLRRRGEFGSHGIGPHELVWLVPGRRLAVANGGILTLPESGRIKLNLAQMAPSLAVVDVADGRLVAEHVLPDRTLSLRHLAIAADGTLGIAIQAESPDGRPVDDAPLLAVLRDGALTLAATAPGLGGYAASIAAHGNVFALTATRGNALALWGSDGTPLAAIAHPKPAGVASDGTRLWVSNETGMIAEADLKRRVLTPLLTRAGTRWDNHLVLA
ncbi:DUF1513 domain-containing protein [Jeongeupia sp. USM3]|uniref:DUF1513 domain-containing protein n=1 Tax=Jeongeupia sp. USM3 TaxID=1906741 RepID=UPI00089DF923|nr:DUF1513 domain-containing protein [Jeongeupia sp. USM3]AOY00717.1 hypothetical protein BJP62_09880 [Jeongeupia sp. USM3]